MWGGQSPPAAFGTVSIRRGSQQRLAAPHYSASKSFSSLFTPVTPLTFFVRRVAFSFAFSV